MRVVRALGLESDVNAYASAPRSIIVRDGLSGRDLSTVELGPSFEARHRAPYLTIHRGELQRVMVERAERDGIQIELGYEAESRRGKATYFANGASATPDLTVVSDGIHSKLVVDTGARSPSGYSAWRATCRSTDVSDTRSRSQTSLWLMPDAHLVRYPIHSGQSLNYVLVLHSARSPSQGNLPPIVHKAVHHLSDWRDWPIEDRTVRSPWAGDGFAVIGDAAHAMWPYAAQGGAMAIEDGWTLAATIARTGCGEASLASWETERRRRVGAVAAISRRNRRIYHASGMVRFGRNLAMRTIPSKILLRGMDRIYSWVPPVIRSSP